jgi:hypothetical protein
MTLWYETLINTPTVSSQQHTVYLSLMDSRLFDATRVAKVPLCVFGHRPTKHHIRPPSSAGEFDRSCPKLLHPGNNLAGWKCLLSGKADITGDLGLPD